MARVLPWLAPVTVLAAAAAGAPWAFRAAIWIYVAALFADLFAGIDTREREEAPLDAPLLRLGVAMQAAVLIAGLLVVSREGTSGAIYVCSIGVGAIGGMFGVPVAHELMHRRNRLDGALAEVLMTMFSYTHFCIEHVRGHHSNVGLYRDPATARAGESLYAFLPRTVLGGIAHASRLQPRTMMRYAVMLVTAYAAVGMLFGWNGVVFFAAQSVVCIVTLETINYVEHYGLSRRDDEPVSERLSWNSSHRISNWLLFNLPRHSDHHLFSQRPFAQLRHNDGPRQLPAGYFAMFALALFPPLWRQIMDPLVAANEVPDERLSRVV